MSNVKVEAAATNAVRNLINLSDSMTSDEIKEGDRGVSFDGSIPLYLDSKIKKENFCNKIDIQVKGRSVDNLSTAETHKFSMDASDIQNYKNVGGAIIFYVQVNRDRTETRMYVKSLLPYEINQIQQVTDKKKIPLTFEHIDDNDSKKLEFICFQFQNDKDKQYSYRDNYKTIEDFEKKKGIFKLGIDVPGLAINPVQYLNKKSFVYFQPEEYDNIQIPCGIAELTSLKLNRNLDIQIGSEMLNRPVEIKKYSDYVTVNINDGILFNSKSNMFTFNLNSNLQKAMDNIEIIKKFIKNETLTIEDNKLSIQSGCDYSIFERQTKIIDMLNSIVKKLNINVEPIVDFSDIESLKNTMLVYNNIIEKKGIPFKNEYGVFLLKISIFNIDISFAVEQREDKTYDLYDLYDVIANKKDIFSYVIKDDERIIVSPNFSVLNKTFKLDISYLMADNVVYKLDELDTCEEKVLNSNDLEMNLSWFILDGLEYCDNNKNRYYELILKFLEKVSKCLLKTRNDTCIDIYYINYCQILKRLNELKDTEINRLVLIRDKTDDQMIKTCISILLDDENSFEVYYKELNDEQKETIKSYPIYNLLKKA